MGFKRDHIPITHKPLASAIRTPLTPSWARLKRENEKTSKKRRKKRLAGCGSEEEGGDKGVHLVHSLF